MKNTVLAARYSKALFELAKETNEQDKIFSEIRALADVLDKNPELKSFLTSPLVKADKKESALQAALENSGLSEKTKNFLYLLASNNRLGIFSEIVSAFQLEADESHGVTRGQVNSATVLNSSEREAVEKTVSQITGKRVILSYHEDPSLIGGVVAKVGSFTFDDSLSSHLTRLKEEINRRTH